MKAIDSLMLKFLPGALGVGLSIAAGVRYTYEYHFH